MRLRNDVAVLSAPATVSNLGPGLDSLALALNLLDQIHLRAVVGGTRIRIDGRASDHDAEDATHPLVVALRSALDHAGAPQVGVDLHVSAAIPRNRGLGARTASTLLGLYAARVLLGDSGGLNDETIASLAVDLGADRVRVPAVMNGGFSLQTPAGRAVLLRTPPLIRPVVFVPGFAAEGSTLGPATPVTLAGASRNLARTALLTLLLSGVEVANSTEEFYDLLMTATEDDLHQAQLEISSPASLALISWLRAKGIPAVVTGTGSTVVSLLAVSAEVQHAARQSGWEVVELGVAQAGVALIPGHAAHTTNS